jgi:hypothetical protein
MANWQAPAARVFVRRPWKTTQARPAMVTRAYSPYGKESTCAAASDSSLFVARHSEPEQI